MRNPIPTSHLFRTPDSFAEIEEFIENLTTTERINAYMVFCMTLNLCNKLVKQEGADE